MTLSPKTHLAASTASAGRELTRVHSLGVVTGRPVSKPLLKATAPRDSLGTGGGSGKTTRILSLGRNASLYPTQRGAAPSFGRSIRARPFGTRVTTPRNARDLHAVSRARARDVLEYGTRRRTLKCVSRNRSAQIARRAPDSPEPN